MMNIGVVFPQIEFGADPAAVKEYAQTVEAMGYTHICAYDHVLGANPDRPGGWSGSYTHISSFIEPFVLFTYMAAVTQKVSYMPSIIVLPQRQTALVAKQAATLDVLSGGRLRIGVGIGWNEVEYEALGMDFHNRGRRIEEQVAVLRQLWTQPLVTFKGRWHTISDAGLNPMPVQRPIPVYLGGRIDAALRRAARLGDGWLPNYRSPAEGSQDAETLRRYLDEEGRQLGKDFIIEARLVYGAGDPKVWMEDLHAWKALGATNFSVNTMNAGFKTPAEHLEALRKYASTMFDEFKKG
jgi:probable F420-dependent oxidoreductase